MSNRDRIVEIANKTLSLGRDPDMYREFADSDVSSKDAMAFLKALSDEYGIEISPDNLKNFADIVAYVDANA